MFVLRSTWSSVLPLSVLVLGACSASDDPSPFSATSGCEAQGIADCGGYCANLGSDPLNCGTCGADCGALLCSNGVCQASCDAGLVQCGQGCSDTLTDPFNCGVCGTACATDQACEDGTCVATVAGTGGVSGVGGTGNAAGTGATGNATGSGGTPTTGSLNGFFPTTVTEDYARGVYDTWVADWVVSCPDGSLRVEWDDVSQTVSEGIGYGMLLAAAWGDQATLDGLYAYFQSHLNANGMMGWIGNCSGSSDSGSATDADLDVAMALLIADCTWPGQGYGDAATGVINAIRTHVMRADGSHIFLCAGDNWGEDCCGNASYQAPAYYRTFGKHVGDEAWWNQAADDSYYYLDANSNATTGLVSDWMDPDSLRCDAKGWGDWHGWDASRVPWRVATDFVWWNHAPAQQYAAKIAAFVQSQGGIASTCQGYSLDGSQCGGTAVSTFAGAFASTGIAVDQATADTFFQDLKGVDRNGYFNAILNALYFTLAAKRFTPGCY